MESTAPNRRQQIAALLKRYWGFDTFRPVQEQVILTMHTPSEASPGI